MMTLPRCLLVCAAIVHLVACTDDSGGATSTLVRGAQAYDASLDSQGPVMTRDASLDVTDGVPSAATSVSDAESPSTLAPDRTWAEVNTQQTAADAAADPTTTSVGTSSERSVVDVASTSADDGRVEDAGAPPVLTELRIEGVRFDVQPTFAPERRRYAAVAEQTPGNLRIVADAEPGLTITVDGQLVERGVPLALPDAQPGTTIIVAVTNAVGLSQTYEIQYLPTTFPLLRAGTNEPGASQEPLYSTFRVNVGVSYAAMVDNFGVPYHYAGHAAPVFDLKKHPNGELSYAVYQEGESRTGVHVVLDQHFIEKRRVVSVGLQDTDFHEFRILPNGNYIMLAYEPAVRDATVYGGSATQAVRDSTFQEVSPAREVLFQWNSWGQLAYDQSVYANTNIDYAHVNSVDVDADGNYLISSRGLSQVTKIDKVTGQIVWRLGGAGNDFTFIDDPLFGTCGQHDAHWLPNGNLLVFDNGNPCPIGDGAPGVERPNVSRVVEYEIDEQQRTAKLVWEYSRPGIFVTAAGSARRLANGNTLIGWGNASAACATEVDQAGKIVFDLTAYRPEPGLMTYRAFRFPWSD